MRRPVLKSSESPASDSDGTTSDRLTPREREVLKLVTDGASSKEVGRLLRISPRTVEVHRSRIMEKLGAKNAADLVRLAMSSISREG
jgi:DNA-binding CsgD family transcriptional regulator